MITRGPVQFWYVTPEKLVKVEELPVWAGLIEIIEYRPLGSDGKENPKAGVSIYEREVQPAPRRHSIKLDPETA